MTLEDFRRLVRQEIINILEQNVDDFELDEAKKRNYKKEYEQYHSKPKQKKRRAQRNAARRKMKERGHVRKGDGKDVHHRNNNTSDNSSKNLAVMAKSKNRSIK